MEPWERVLGTIPKGGAGEPGFDVGDIPQNVEGSQFQELGFALFPGFAAPGEDPQERHRGALGGAGIVDVVADVHRAIR